MGCNVGELLQFDVAAFERFVRLGEVLRPRNDAGLQLVARSLEFDGLLFQLQIAGFQFLMQLGQVFLGPLALGHVGADGDVLARFAFRV